RRQPHSSPGPHAHSPPPEAPAHSQVVAELTPSTNQRHPPDPLIRGSNGLRTELSGPRSEAPNSRRLPLRLLLERNHDPAVRAPLVQLRDPRSFGARLDPRIAPPPARNRALHVVERGRPGAGVQV